MPQIEPFCAFRYDPARVELHRVLAPGRDTPAPDATQEEPEPRQVTRLEAPTSDPVAQTRARFFWADWVRAQVVQREETPSLYLVRQSAPDGEWERVGLVAQLALTDAETVAMSEAPPSAPPSRESVVQCAPVSLLFHDERRRVSRLLDGEMDERDPDLQLALGGVDVELWVIDDETTLGRLCAQLQTATATVVDGHERYAAARERDASLLVYLVAAEGDDVGLLRAGEPMETVAFTAAISDEGAAPAGTYSLAHPLPRGLVLAPLEPR